MLAPVQMGAVWGLITYTEFMLYNTWFPKMGYTVSYKKTSQVTIPYLKEQLESGQYGVLYINSHASPSAIGVEYYSTWFFSENQVQQRMNQLISTGVVESNEVDIGQTFDGWSIAITPQFIRNHARLANGALVFVHGCDTMGAQDWADAFTHAPGPAAVFVGYDSSIPYANLLILNDAWATSEFFGRMVQGKNVDEAVQGLHVSQNGIVASLKAAGLGSVVLVQPSQSYSVSFSSASDDGRTDVGPILFGSYTISPPATMNIPGPQSYVLSVNAPGYTFDHWSYSGGVTVDNANQQQTRATVNSAGTLSAYFKKGGTTYFSVSLSSYADDGSSNIGQITVAGAAYSLPATVSKTAGSYSVSMSAPSGYDFDHWETSGSVSISGASLSVSGNGEVKAFIKKRTGGSVLLTVGTDPTGVCTPSGGGSYSYNAVAQVSVPGQVGDYYFFYWRQDGQVITGLGAWVSADGLTLYVRMDTPHTVIAVFDQRSGATIMSRTTDGQENIGKIYDNFYIDQPFAVSPPHTFLWSVNNDGSWAPHAL